MRHTRMMIMGYLQDWGRVRQLDFDKAARLKRERYHANLEWISGTIASEGGGELVTFDSPHFPKVPALGDFDLVREYLPYAQKYGIDAIAYVNLHWYSYDFAAEHPGWEQLLEDGTPYGRRNPLYGNGTTMCINSPWREWAFLLLREAMRTGIKGVFLDGPVVYPGACYCAHCHRLFKQHNGEEPPKWGDWENPVWAEFLRFRGESMCRFLKDARAAVRGVKEDGTIFLNAGAWPSWETPVEITELAPHQDISGAEAFYHLAQTTEPYFQLRVGKYLKASAKPSVVFVSHCHGVWHYLPMQGDELKLALAQTLAAGCNTWIALINGELLEEERAWAPVHDALEVTERHPDAFEDTQPVADVGILVSSDTAFFYRSQEDGLFRHVETEAEENLIAKGGAGARISALSEQKSTSDRLARDEANGYFDLLTHQRVPFRFVLEQRLEEELKGLEILILPNQACLSERRKQMIEHFVRQGGKLIASFESGRYDAEGEPDQGRFFEQVLGVKQIEGLFPLEVREEYIRFGETALGSESGTLVPRPTYVLKALPTDASTMPAKFLEPTGQHYAPLKGESPYPAFWSRCIGEGQVVYLPALYGAFYRTYREPGTERFLGELVRSLLSSEPPVRIEGPASVTYELFRKGEAYIVHLLNGTGDMQRPVSLVDVQGVKVHFADPVRSVRALVCDRDLELHREGWDTWVELPKLGVHEVLVAEMQP